MQIIPNQSEKRFVPRLLKNGQKSIRLNPINFETSIQMNPNECESIRNQVFNTDQSELGFIQTEFAIRINTNNSDLRFIRINSD